MPETSSLLGIDTAVPPNVGTRDKNGYATVSVHVVPAKAGTHTEFALE